MMNSLIRGRHRERMPRRPHPSYPRPRSCTVRAARVLIPPAALLLVAALLAANAAAAPAIRGDAPERPKITINAATVSVGEIQDATAAFEVSLTTPDPERNTTVDYRTVNNTARAGLDYVDTSGTLTIPPAEISAVIFVPIIDDSIPEGRETFKFMITNPAATSISAETSCRR